MRAAKLAPTDVANAAGGGSAQRGSKFEFELGRGVLEGLPVVVLRSGSKFEFELGRGVWGGLSGASAWGLVLRDRGGHEQEREEGHAGPADDFAGGAERARVVGRVLRFSGGALDDVQHDKPNQPER